MLAISRTIPLRPGYPLKLVIDTTSKARRVEEGGWTFHNIKDWEEFKAIQTSLPLKNEGGDELIPEIVDTVVPVNVDQKQEHLVVNDNANEVEVRQKRKYIKRQ
jgi:hypothetical protein